jgi:hypothetical protein
MTYKSEWGGFFLFDKRTWKTITNKILFLFISMDFQLLSFINQFGHGTRLDIFSQYISWDISLLIVWAVVIALALFFKKKYWKFVLLSFVFAGILFY